MAFGGPRHEYHRFRACTAIIVTGKKKVGEEAKAKKVGIKNGFLTQTERFFFSTRGRRLGGQEAEEKKSYIYVYKKLKDLRFFLNSSLLKLRMKK